MRARHPLAILRLAAELTQNRLADRAHVARRTVAAIETGEWIPRYPTRRRLLAALGVEFARHREIFDGERNAA